MKRKFIVEQKGIFSKGHGNGKRVVYNGWSQHKQEYVDM